MYKRQPYNDSPLNERVTALENRPAIGGSVDTSKFVTGELLESELEQLASSATKPLYIPYHHDTAKNYLDNTTTPSEKTFPDKRAGKILANVDKQNLENIQIFKGDENNSQFVDFDAAMYSLANSLPTDYSLESVRQDINNKVLFLSNKNFSEVVPKEELKNIIREVGGTESTGSNIDTSNLATKEELAKAVTKEELETKHYVTEEELNNKAYLTTHQSLDNVVTKEELATKGYISDVSNLVTKEELESKNYLTTPYNDTPLKERVEALEYKVGYDNSLGIELKNSVNSLQKRVDDLEYKLRNYDDIDSYLATKNELNDYVKRTELPAPYDDTNLRNEFNFMVNSAVDNELRNKEYEFNSRFVAKNDLRTLVTEIVNQLKSENN